MSWSSQSVSRREILRGFGASGMALLAGCGSDTSEETSPSTTPTPATGADNTTDRVTIGVLQPLSGSLKYYGVQSAQGFFTGLAYKAGTNPPNSVLSSGLETYTVDGTEFEVVVRDTDFSPEKARQSATTLIEKHNADVLFGCASSDAAARIASTVTEPSSVPYVAGPAASASLTADAGTCNELVFRANANTAMDARAASRYLSNLSDISSVYLFGADYSFGRAVIENYERSLSEFGVSVEGTELVPRGHSSWQGLLESAQEAGVDGIIGGFTVATLPNLFEAFLKNDWGYRLLGNMTTRATVSEVGKTLSDQLGTPLTRSAIEDANLGPFVTRYHWNQYKNPINQAFRDSYTKSYGQVPDLFTAGTFTAASAIVQAVTTSGGTSAADISQQLRGMTVSETPKGRDKYTFQEYNNQARSPMTLANYVPTTDAVADLWDAPVQPGDPVSQTNAELSTIPKDSSALTCSL